MNTYMAMWDKVADKYKGEYGPYIESYKAKTGMREITFIGRAGEGVWTAGDLLCEALSGRGKYCRINFIMPGDRGNVLSRSFLTYANEPISFPVCWIHSADDMLVFEEELLTLDSLVFGVDISVMTRWMNPQGFCVVNSPKRPNEIRGNITGKPVTVDATRISHECFGHPFFLNIPVIGAYLATRKDILTIEEMETAIKNFINPRGHKLFDGERGEQNIKALRAGYKSVRF